MRDMPKVFDTEYIIYLNFEEAAANGGVAVKIKDDAPEWVKQEFEEFLKGVNPSPDENGNITVF